MALRATTILLVLTFFLSCFALPAADQSTTEGLNTAALETSVESSRPAPNLSYATNSNPDTLHGTGDEREELEKRWFSIVEPDPPIEAFHPTIWPRLQDIPSANVKPGDPNAEERWVRFCFKNQESADQIKSTLMHAAARWAPAERYSTLRIRPDIGCKDDWGCVCGPHTLPDALQIRNPHFTKAQERPSRINMNAATLGYSPDIGKRRNGMVLSSFSDELLLPGFLESTVVHEIGRDRLLYCDITSGLQLDR